MLQNLFPQFLLVPAPLDIPSLALSSSASRRRSLLPDSLQVSGMWDYMYPHGLKMPNLRDRRKMGREVEPISVFPLPLPSPLTGREAEGEGRKMPDS